MISKAAEHVNESMKQVDNFKKLMEVQKKLIGDGGDNLISPSRVSQIIALSTINYKHDIDVIAAHTILYVNTLRNVLINACQKYLA